MVQQLNFSTVECWCRRITSWQLLIGNQSKKYIIHLFFFISCHKSILFSSTAFQRSNGLLIAVLGAFDIYDDSLPKKSIAMKVKQIIYHPEFNERTFDNDLAQLKLERPIQFDTHISKKESIFFLSLNLHIYWIMKLIVVFVFKKWTVPICLPAHGADFTDRIATVSGWGRLRYGGRFPTVLQEVEVKEIVIYEAIFESIWLNEVVIKCKCVDDFDLMY